MSIVVIMIQHARYMYLRASEIIELRKPGIWGL